MRAPKYATQEFSIRDRIRGLYIGRYKVLGGTHLITASAAGLQHFRIVALAVDLVVVDTVGEVHQEQVAGAAGEALGVPHHALHKLGRRHNQLAGGYLVITVRTMLIVGGILDVGYSNGRKCKTQSVKSFWARSSLGY